MLRTPCLLRAARKTGSERRSRKAVVPWPLTLRVLGANGESMSVRSLRFSAAVGGGTVIAGWYSERGIPTICA